ncbi:MAG TPA: signal peptidase I [Patescibacteria group bacterium]|nr:signal peptidase I [Patescibacteria group bacterium]
MNKVLDLRPKDGESSEDKEEIFQDPIGQQERGAGLRKFWSYFFEIVKIFIISLLIIVPVRMYVIQPFIVDGDSMEPNFHDGEYLIVDEISYRFKEPNRGEVIIFHPPQDPQNYYIKRIIGLPGETVELTDGRIIIYNGQYPAGEQLDESQYLVKSRINEIAKVELGENEYYVVGDNRNNSLDSRRFGAIQFANIRGKALLRAFPFNKLAILKSPEYIIVN